MLPIVPTPTRPQGIVWKRLEIWLLFEIVNCLYINIILVFEKRPEKETLGVCWGWGREQSLLFAASVARSKVESAPTSAQC